MWQEQNMYAGNAEELPACPTFVVAKPWFKRAASIVKLVVLQPQWPVTAVASPWDSCKLLFRRSPLGDFLISQVICVLIYFLLIV